MTIAPFGWHDDASPDINSGNLELDRAQIAAYGEAFAEAAVAGELTRAEAAEATLATNLAAEVTARVTAVAAAAAASIPLTQKGATNGVGSLDGEGHQPVAQVSPSVETSSANPPSGDETGATDTTLLAALMPAKGILKLRPGAYYVTALPTVGPEQAIQASAQTLVYMVGTGTCLRIFNPAFPTGGGEIEFVKNMPGKCGGFVIDLSKAGPKAIGVWIGDINNTHCEDLIVRHGTGAEQINWLFKSEIGWCERNLILNCFSINGSNLVVFDNGGAGTGSFDASHFEFNLLAYPNQNGIVMQGGVQFLHSHLRVCGGPFFSGEGNTGVVWKLGADNSNVLLTGARIDLQVEIDGTVGTGHKTIEMGTGAECHAQGVLAFLKGGGTVPFATGNVTTPNVKFTFSGYIKVDASLGENQAGEGLNVLGGSTWAKGSSLVSEGKLQVGVNGGDYFTTTLANGANTLVLKNVYPGRARRIYLVLTQPAAGEPATVSWAEPGNNVGGAAQTIIWSAGGGSVPVLQTANGAVDVLSLITPDGQKWYASVLSTALAVKVLAANLGAESVTESAIKKAAVSSSRLAGPAALPSKPAEGATGSNATSPTNKRTTSIVGNGSTKNFVIKHELGTRLISIVIQKSESEQPVAIEPIVGEAKAISAGEAEVRFTVAPGAGVLLFVTVYG